MSDVKLGEHAGYSGDRDAIHMAVIAVHAGEALDPGAKVSHSYSNVVERYREGLRGQKLLGVVDPFLTEVVKAGETFWLLLVPGSVHKLRHAWETDEFPESREDEWDDGCRGC